MAEHRQYEQAKLLEAIAVTERTIVFRFTRADDRGEIQVKRAIVSYKGGPRFHLTVSAGLVRLVAFEQVFENALTTLLLGGAKRGLRLRPERAQ
jgi:glutamate dehydrogenase (NADP+)